MDNLQLKFLMQKVMDADESLADRVFTNYPIISELLLTSPLDLQRIKGITPYKAMKLYSAFQTAKEINHPREMTFIKKPQDRPALDKH